MGRENIELIDIAVIGSTKLTYKLLHLLEDIQRPKYVFGLPDDILPYKVNSVRLDEFCQSKHIILDKSNNWKSFEHYCEKNGIKIVLEFGDSRIIPKFITSMYQIIGNHGALLPYVQGAASLVWGRLLNNREWGVSLFELNEKIDSGDILINSNFEYDETVSMKDFIELADDLTIKIFLEIIRTGYQRQKNKTWNIRVKEGTDTYKAIEFLRKSLRNSLNIYMPKRSPEDSKLNKNWPIEFQKIFKLANNDPYPRWYYNKKI